jgi:hypothetical protein
VYFGRPEVEYLAHVPEITLHPSAYIISIQPAGTLDNFFQLTAATGQDAIFGIEVHVSYPDADYPPWTPGHVVFGEYHDLTFSVWGEWVTDGTETCEEWCGTQSPFGCWCDEECDLFGDCCDDVCDECPDNTFCDPDIDPYVCEGFCGEMAPGGCWCDEWCDSFNDCCDDVCDECDEDVSFCDPNIDPYDCAGDLNGDGVVDGGDLLILLSNWGNFADPEDCPADLNEDGVVDGGDLLILLSNWGECPIPQTTFCFWTSGTIALTFNPDDPAGEDVFTVDLTPAFVPMCLKVQPGPYASGEDIAVGLTQARFQGFILAGDDEDDFAIGMSAEVLETPPSSRGVITNVVANADGELVTGDLYLEAHLRLNSSIGDFSNGLETIGVPVVLHSPGMTGMFEVGQTFQMLAGEEPIPLFSLAPRELAGSITDLVLTANEEADEEDKHECPAPGPGCQTSCPEIVIDSDKTESIISGWRRGEASYGTRFRFRYNPAEPVCAHILWSFTTDADENGCNLANAYTNQSSEWNSKCSDPRRLDLEFVARLPASTQDPDECPCETISFLNIYCKDKDHPDAEWGEPIASIQVKWELLENGNVKVTVKDLDNPDNEVSGDEITTWHPGCEDD